MSKKTITHVIHRPMAVDSITIELPYYCRNKVGNYLYHCIVDDDKVLNLLVTQSGGFISTSDDVTKLLNDPSLEPCSREEFIQSYAKVNDSFTKLLPYDGHLDN
jgi:hypothetical protein